ncbi:hypothetical protein AJ78_05982 [Emergomyces pasteurianus Ep9510]|uniref:Uncharacterized protein n=1 Tax=Emergomyces pasteurianus Ep9510 TaxID=1447872 RepID=A0A1J9PBZ3_9EURO|nr:hypothetical protein AJ78_05982 [Emergomyces pasteurianus Ep9510]
MTLAYKKKSLIKCSQQEMLFVSFLIQIFNRL